jgi:putative ubiquitin-RnfH superfamily antitoxin RatB of RatAB toxin-antitoxin module
LFGKNEEKLMIFKIHWGVIASIVWLSLLNPLAWTFGASQELRPASQLSGLITAAMEEGKQALSAGDKIFVALSQARLVKKGDRVEIFQPLLVPAKDNSAQLFAKVGQAIVLEITGEGLLLCEIISSQKEVAVGDGIYFSEE